MTCKRFVRGSGLSEADEAEDYLVDLQLEQIGSKVQTNTRIFVERLPIVRLGTGPAVLLGHVALQNSTFLMQNPSF